MEEARDLNTRRYGRGHRNFMAEGTDERIGKRKVEYILWHTREVGEKRSGLALWQGLRNDWICLGNYHSVWLLFDGHLSHYRTGQCRGHVGPMEEGRAEGQLKAEG